MQGTSPQLISSCVFLSWLLQEKADLDRDLVLNASVASKAPTLLFQLKPVDMAQRLLCAFHSTPHGIFNADQRGADQLSLTIHFAFLIVHARFLSVCHLHSTVHFFVLDIIPFLSRSFKIEGDNKIFS